MPDGAFHALSSKVTEVPVSASQPVGWSGPATEEYMAGHIFMSQSDRNGRKKAQDSRKIDSKQVALFLTVMVRVAASGMSVAAITTKAGKNILE